MNTIQFSATIRAGHTHRITDGTESSYFAWPAGAVWGEVLQAYADGYDFNGSEGDCEVWCYPVNGYTPSNTGVISA